MSSQPVSLAPPGADMERVRGAESRLEFALAGLMSLVVAGTLFYVYTLFAPLVPESRLNLWAGATLAVTLIMAAVPLAFYLAQPDDAAIARFWSPLGKLVAILFDLAVASSVWLLLPYASEPLRLLMVIFYSAAISGQVVSTAESTGTIIFGVVTIFGSAALFFFLNETIYAVPLGLFLLGFGAMMIVVALILKQAIRTAIRLRIEAERISADLEKALGTARRERESRTRFVAATSHDLRQPIQAALLFAHNAAQATTASDQQSAIDGIRRGLAEANSLLENMADHLRFESGAVTPRPGIVAMGDVFAQLAQEMAPLAQRAHIDLRWLAVRDPQAHADPALVARIIRNLVHNAITHAQCARIRIFARMRREVEICVIDDGIGIDMEQQQSYLAAYSQGPAAQRHGQGSGLGLAIASELAALMNGRITLHSAMAGQGLHIRLTLPSAAGVAAELPLPAPTGGQLLTGRKLLVVDDYVDTLEAMAEWCRWQGAIEVHTAASEAALRDQLCRGFRPDLLLTDWHIGGPGTSTDLVREFRATLPGIPIIVMTGDASKATQDDIAALGLPVMLKPVDEAKLAAALAQLTG